MDLSAISTVSYIIPQKATDNFLRLCRVIKEPCTDILRFVFSHYIKPSNLRTELDNNKIKIEKHFEVPQRELIYPATGNRTLAVKDFDISILYILLRNICKIPRHKNGWGRDPQAGDNSIAACIERIRLQRNSMIAHSTCMVEDTKFQDSWRQLRYCIVEIEKQLFGGDLFQRCIDSLYSCDICIVQRGMTQSKDKSVQGGYIHVLLPRKIKKNVNIII